MSAKTTALALVMLVGTPLGAMADDQPKLSCVKDITFSQEFLAKYPHAGDLCREVVMKDGMKWARFDANVVEVNGDQVTVNFVDKYGQGGRTLTFVPSADARVTVDGKSEKASDLKRGDSLTFWVPESRMGFYAQPGTLNTGKFAVVSEGSTEKR
jgi:hypothetical protein